jgi:hypothetical protein
MNNEEQWEYFRGYTAKGIAGLISTKLQMEGIPNRIERIEPRGADGPEFWITVPHEHLQHAIAVRAQLPIEENELTYLATMVPDE